MKKILFLLFISISAFGQRIAQNHIDEFTDAKIIKVDASEGKKWKTTDNVATGFFNNIFLSTRFVGSDINSIILNVNIQIGQTVCLSEYEGMAILLLKDNSKITLKQVSRVDCNSSVDGKYILGESFAEQLENLKILEKINLSKIRIYTTNGYLDFEIKDKKQEIIKNHFKILHNEIGDYLSKK